MATTWKATFQGSAVEVVGNVHGNPKVANLAAELFALDPQLMPRGAIGLIRRGATSTEDGLHWIDEKLSVALLQAQAKNSFALRGDWAVWRHTA